MSSHISNRSLLFTALSAIILFCAACSGKGKGNFPSDFESISDAARIDYMMKHAAPDSVARFLIDVSLGHVEGARIDTLPNAVLYCYEHYKDEDLASFSNQFDLYTQSLPLPDRMKIYSLAGQIDPQQLGYQLGLEYVGTIRSRKMTPDQVSEEIKEFKKACGSDTATYRRFVQGFKVVLDMERGNGISPEVYNRFINLSEH